MTNEERRKEFYKNTKAIKALLGELNREDHHNIIKNMSKEWISSYAEEMYYLYHKNLIVSDFPGHNVTISEIFRDFISVPLKWANGDMARHVLLKNASPDKINNMAIYCGEYFHVHMSLLLTENSDAIYKCAEIDPHVLTKKYENIRDFFEYNTVIESIFALDMNDTINKILENKKIFNFILNNVGISDLVGFCCQSHKSNFYIEKIMTKFGGMANRAIIEHLESGDVFNLLPEYEKELYVTIEQNIEKLIKKTEGFIQSYDFSPLNTFLNKGYLSRRLLKIYAKHNLSLKGIEICPPIKKPYHIHDLKLISAYDHLCNFYEKEKSQGDFFENIELAKNINKIIFLSLFKNGEAVWELIEKNKFTKAMISFDIIADEEKWLAITNTLSNCEMSAKDRRIPIDIEGDVDGFFDAIGDSLSGIPEMYSREILASLKIVYLNRDLLTSLYTIIRPEKNCDIDSIELSIFSALVHKVTDLYLHKSIKNDIENKSHAEGEVVISKSVIVVNGSDKFKGANVFEEWHPAGKILEARDEYLEL